MPNRRQLAREAGAAVRQDLFEVGEVGMAVNELAQTLAINASEVVKILFMKGLMVTVNQVHTNASALRPSVSNTWLLLYHLTRVHLFVC